MNLLKALLSSSGEPRPRHRLRRSNTTPGPPRSPCPPPPAATHILENEGIPAQTEGVKGGGEGKLQRERRNEEHGALVAAQVFRPRTGDFPRTSFQAALATALATATQGFGEVKLWAGHLSSATSKELNQLAVQVGLSWEGEQLAWWVVGSRLAVVDASWTLSQLHRVQSVLSKGTYSEEETAELLHSLTLYIHSQVKRLRILHTAFHVQPSNQLHTQLAYTLRSLRSIEEHPATRDLLDQAGQPPVGEDVAAALLRHAHDRWEEMLGTCGWRAGGRVRLGDAAPLLYSLPARVQEFNQHYNDVFQKELNISYAAISHRELARQLAQLTKALLDATPTRALQVVWGEERPGCLAMENFGIGSLLWSVYKSLGHVYSMGEEWCGRESCFPPDYPGCFLGSVGAWLTYTHHHTLLRLQHPHPSPITKTHNHSLDELLRAFKEAGRWWEELSWPEADTGGVLVVLLIQHLSSLASTYCQGLAQACSHDTSTDTSSENSSDYEEAHTHIPPPRLAPSTRTYFDTKVYSCLATVWGAGEAVANLPATFDVADVVRRLGGSGRAGAVEQLTTTVCALLPSVMQNLDTLTEEVILAAVDKIRPRLREEVKAACEGGKDNTPPLLYLSLHNTLINLQRQFHLPSLPDILSSVLSSPSRSQNLSSSSFAKAPPFSSSRSLILLPPSQIMPSPSSDPNLLSPPSQSTPSPSSPSPSPSSPSLLSPSPSSPSQSTPSPSSSSSSCPQQRLQQHLWDALVVQFMVLVAESIGKRSAEYFSGVLAVLESVFSLLTSPGRLHPVAASTPGYQSVVEQARQQRVSTLALISRYYQERYGQQINSSLPITAQVLIRAYFSQPGRLTVRVLEARNVAAAGGYGRGRGRGLGLGSSRNSAKYHIQVEVVPSEAFPGASLCRTSSSSRCPPAFYDTFEFPTGVCGIEGFLHLSLVTSGVVVGEALLPLPIIPYLDSPTLQNTTLAMTSPAFHQGYQALTALRSRVWDERAATFVRQLERRHPEARIPTQESSGPALTNTHSHS